MPTPLADDQLLVHANRVRDKVVIITGASRSYAKSKVVIGDVNAVNGNAVAETIRKEGGEVAFIKCDVTKWEEQVAVFELAIARFGTVDVVIPNAGISESEEICMGNLKFAHGKPAAPQLLTLNVNLIGAIYTTHLGVYYMKRSGSPSAWKSLIMIGSMAKHAVLGLVRSLDPVAAKDNIRTACIHPWFTETNLLDWKLRTLIAGIPMTPVERVARAVFRAATDPDPATSGCAWLLPDDGPVLLLEKEEMREGVYDTLNRRVRRIVR
ncbi:hypothetical protein BC827DRAFT_1261991 [Russula dissimulans]|nr:hypothetical protein BC827DRAFT_1261991 [Russula dissimulans]